MAWMQSDLDALSAALAKGLKSVTFADGRKVEYQTTADMLKVRDKMQVELNTADVTTGRTRVVVGRIRHRC